MSTRSYTAALPFAAALCLTFVIGYLVGRIVALHLSGSDVPAKPTITQEEKASTPVVRFDRIVNGELHGSIRGEARVFLGDELLGVGSGSFHVPAKALLENIITVQVPAGMKFVASKKGSRFYSVDSSQGAAILPENRVYFRDEAAARAAGYK